MKAMLFLLIFSVTNKSFASIEFDVTGVFQSSNNEDAFIIVHNRGEGVLFDSCIESEDGRSLPLTVTPRLTKITPNEYKVIRIHYPFLNGVTKKESAYWINMYALPLNQSPNTNMVKFGLRQRIKVICML